MSETLRSDIVAVLSGHEVEWDAETFLRHNAVMFMLDGRKIAVSFGSEAEAADVVRQKLRDLGAREKPSASPPIAEPAAEASSPEPERKVIENKQGYSVFRSAEVIGIELETDMMIEKGRILVIPLRQVNKYINMSKDDFLALFGSEANALTYLNHTGEHPRRPKVAPPAPPTTANEENDILAFLRTRTGGVKPAAIAMALGMKEEDVLEHLRKLRIRNIVLRGDGGFWRLMDKMPRPAPKRQPPNGERARGSITPQEGRILAAMAYVARASNRTELTTQDVKPLLETRDGKQYSARLPGLTKKGFAIRGRPLPKAKGWHYQLSPEGIKAVQAEGFWFYEADQLPPPEWLVQVAVRSD